MPVTIFIDERSHGIHLSYDQMANFLSTWGSHEARKIAEDFDSIGNTGNKRPGERYP